MDSHTFQPLRRGHSRMNTIHCLLALATVLAASGCRREGSTETRVSSATEAAHVAKSNESEQSTGTAPTLDFRNQFVAAASAIRPAVVSINSTEKVEPRGGASPFEGTPFEFFFRGIPRGNVPQIRRGVGSGTIIDAEGHILTNNHVIAGADEVKVVFADNHEVVAKVVGADAKTDIAVVKVDPGAAKLQAAVLGDSDKLQVGEWVLACGSPFGLKQTVSAGIVSAVGRGNVGIAEYEDFIQTDAAINPGNSGGPLVDLQGRIVGVNTAIASGSGGNVGVGFAIPIKMAAQVMRQLLDHGKVVRGYVGLYIADVTDKLAQSFAYKGAGGALVQDVTAGAPGDQAGLKPGDIIVAIGGQPVLNAAEFRNAIAASAPGTEVELKIWRDREEMTKQVKLGQLPASEAVATGGPGKPAEPRWGLQLSDIPSQLKDRAQQGALVTQVQPESPADDAGLHPGDIVIDVQGNAVASASQAQRLLQSAKSPVRIRVLREGHGLFLVLQAKQG
jgi:serine protease Do